MYKIGTKFKASVEYEIINNSENDCYRVRWLEAGVYKTGAQDKEALTRFMISRQENHQACPGELIGYSKNHPSYIKYAANI